MRALLIAVCVASCVWSGGVARAAPAAPERLRVEYLSEPLAVAGDAPRFSWEVVDTARGAVQAAYEVRVASSAAGLKGGAPDAWGSGKVASAQSANIEYAGKPLAPGARYYWTVRTWDAGGKESPWAAPVMFGVELAPGDWKAKWIGDSTRAPEGKAPRNGYHSQFADKAQTPVAVSVELGEAMEFDTVRLWPARPYDSKDTTGFCFPLRYRVLALQSVGLETPKTLVDRSDADQPSPGTEAVPITFPPTKARTVMIEVPVLREATQGKYALALAEVEVISKGVVISTGAQVSTLSSIENRDWAAKYLTDGETTSHGVVGFEALPAPMFRKEFELPAKGVARATLYISALGLYEARINGQRVGEQELAPEWTDYHARVQYQTYDVTKMVHSAKNAVGVQVADGWYAGRLGMAQGFTPDRRPRAVYGRQPRLIAQLVVELEDGTRETVTTDGTWTSSVGGPVRSADLLDGEVYDARMEQSGWDEPGFQATIDGRPWSQAVVDAGVKALLEPQPNEPIRSTQILMPVSMKSPTPGVFVFDLGQNMPGRCRIRVKGPAGAKVVLRHVEAINDDGTVYTPNLRGAPQVDTYILKGAPDGEVWEPKFTYHGFRYVEWSGDVAPGTNALVGIVVHSDPEVVSEFECSNPMLNKLWSNILWTQHANMMSVPTDCPQRDERLGWMGDILAFAQNAAFNKDMAAFYAKWSKDVRDAQADDGRMPDVAPHPYGKNDRFNGVPAWGDAGVFVPWASYENYADTRLIADHFDSARRWVDWIASKNPDYLWKKERHNDYNDWLNGDSLIADGWPRTGGAIPNEVFATAFFARSAWIVSRMAHVLGKTEEQKKYADLNSRVVAAFNAAYVGPDAKVQGDTQAGYALALAFDLLPADKREAAVERLAKNIEAYKGHLSTGFHSSHHAMLELTKAGRLDLAYTLVNNTTFPSWGYSIENGATTIWERWDGYVKGRGFQDPGMNSLNHWALGSVGEWMMRTIVGINPDPASPGWSHFVLKPQPGGGLTFAKGQYRSLRGVIKSAWRAEGGAMVYSFTVPANTTAEAWLPAENAASVSEGGKPLAAAGVKVLRTEAKRGNAGPWVVMELGAGEYEFVAVVR